VACGSAVSSTAPEQDSTFRRLAEYAGMQELELEVGASRVGGNGLFAKQQVVKGEVVMRIPVAACIQVKRDPHELFTVSWTAPQDGSWANTEDGLARHSESGLPWDLVCALALVDVAVGGGGEFYSEYLKLLPLVQDLHVPFCQPDSLLQQYQNETVITGARGQKERLRSLFPHLMPEEAAEEGSGPSVLQWAYACVRSRAFFLKDDNFAYVPFLDMFNHSSTTPSVGYRLSNSEGVVEVVALTDISAGEEMYLSYTGDQPYPGLRMLQQYGFTLPEGSLADRLPFEISGDSAALSLSKIQDIIGDTSWIGMMSNKDNRLYSVVKSLPFSDNDDAIAAGSDVQLARSLLKQCKASISAFQTSLKEDLVLLSESPPTSLARVIGFRMQEKMLWIKCSDLLKKYINAV